MVALICFVLAVLALPFKSKSRLEAENAALRHQLIVSIILLSFSAVNSKALGDIQANAENLASWTASCRAKAFKCAKKPPGRRHQ
jgi:hypothetical protein